MHAHTVAHMRNPTLCTGQQTGMVSPFPHLRRKCSRCRCHTLAEAFAWLDCLHARGEGVPISYDQDPSRGLNTALPANLPPTPCCLDHNHEPFAPACFLDSSRSRRSKLNVFLDILPALGASAPFAAQSYGNHSPF